jgi:glucan biosynthesis protein C
MQRRPDIDWLRVIATLAVLTFHCSRFFDLEEWHVKNAPGSVFFMGYSQLLVTWIMPMFFVLSGISAVWSRGRRPPGAFLFAKVKRLLVPFVLGTFLLIPPQVYLERVSHGHFTGSFLDFLPHLFEGWYGFGGNFPWMGLHLWYLAVLFIFSLLFLPIVSILAARKNAGRLGAFLAKPGAIFLPILLVIGLRLLVDLQPDGIGCRNFGGWSLALYPLFFLFGCLLGADPRLEEAVQRGRIPALIAAVVTSAMLAASYVPGVWEALDPTLGQVLAASVRPVACWCWLVALLGFGALHLRREGKFLAYASQAVLPFYMLHQTVIVALAFFLISWGAAAGLKYLVLLTCSFAAIVLVYDLLVRRLLPLRLLFGMRPR